MSVCPHCGHCDKCGRRGTAGPIWIVPQPWYGPLNPYTIPGYQGQPYYTTTGGLANQTSSAAPPFTGTISQVSM